mmetsp:Transcript_37126/g.84041  ORF Transcript_37126/g.84041 Transcript_37126/m.84041 type:complete len:267 (-) Transcript_37126:57-857(-)
MARWLGRLRAATASRLLQVGCTHGTDEAATVSAEAGTTAAVAAAAGTTASIPTGASASTTIAATSHPAAAIAATPLAAPALCPAPTLAHDRAAGATIPANHAASPTTARPAPAVPTTTAAAAAVCSTAGAATSRAAPALAAATCRRRDCRPTRPCSFGVVVPMFLPPRAGHRGASCRCRVRGHGSPHNRPRSPPRPRRFWRALGAVRVALASGSLFERYDQFGHILAPAHALATDRQHAHHAPLGIIFSTLYGACPECKVAKSHEF